MTVVPRDKVAPPGFIERVRDRALELIEERDGRPADVEGGSTHVNDFLPNYHWILFEDQLFVEMLMNEVALTLASYLVGHSAVLSTTSILVKGPTVPFPEGNGLQLGLHSDNQMQVAPFHYYSEHCNVTWLLSDYTRDNGALAYVPGSHKLCRHPLPDEGVDAAEAVEGEMGSIVVWGGNTWHGAFPRLNEGLRMAMPFGYERSYMLPRQPYRESVPQEWLDKFGPRFARLMGHHIAVGWRDEGPDYSKVATSWMENLLD
jgi:ectoine hydroxylase-related dioxygenase (phytanoyl-CoA dioxygenase family)